MNATAAIHADGARWRLVGPWYRWPRPGLPDDGRAAPAALQKLAGNDFIVQFMKQPQHTLKFDPVVDVVQEHDLVSARSKLGKLTTFFALDAKGDPLPKGSAADPYRARLAPGTLRKLYQPTHDRHYVVSCELHCDEPGFPRVNRKQVCQAGFVVRRRRSVLPEAVTPQALEAQAKKVRAAEADLFELETLAGVAADTQADATLRANAQKRLEDLAEAQWLPSGAALLARLRGTLADKRLAFTQWQQEQGVSVAIDGWFPTPGSSLTGPRGEWRPLEGDARVADIVSGEQVYPLLPLVPDPREATHDAANRTFYYGVVPTQDLQHDPEGKPHFDDRTTYEAWCFVRVHHACPPKAGRQPDCNGRLVWSLPTEAFRLAAAFDVLGSANRPVTIRMPDLRDLAAQTALRPRGKLSPVHFDQPQHLSPGGIGPPSICSFSIPLITIVALFLLNIFLPIVVFLFQLWFLLLLRFCILPQVSVSLKVDAALAVTPPGVDFEADFAVSVEGVAKTAAQLQALLADGKGGEPTLEDLMLEDAGKNLDGEAPETPNLGGMSNTALAGLAQSYGDNKALTATPASGEPLVYEDSVTPVWPTKGSVA
ncbi:hypothetical protein LZ009_10385 [Ramlibacter sp. XY19]|uniref:hypothetical protein n=1 Tax=Ramlibacter paludis TaxID=2908000 RepID=UPI0023D9DEF4|nr:hypothetical protein [Ramlibacter paludis]MCG2593187.1 hypothetical protein [Ramlibacter paludis]